MKRAKADELTARATQPREARNNADEIRFALHLAGIESNKDHVCPARFVDDSVKFMLHSESSLPEK